MTDPKDPTKAEATGSSGVPKDGEVSANDSSGGLGAGDAIGPYALVKQIGKGAMGVVWLAEQSEPIKRQVALKVIRTGMDFKEVVARFEAERQALAMMEHPTIARILDAGSTPAGSPYFAMEYVRGRSITRYSDAARLSVRERLELFTPVCNGVQHAHQKAMIHRDLKPSNILVAEHEGKPIPKIIVFGVAKALEMRLTESAMHTQIGMMVGTPA